MVSPISSTRSLSRLALSRLALGLAGMGLLLLTASAPMARADDWPEAGDRRLRVWLSTSPHPAIGPLLVHEALARLRRKLAVVFTEFPPEIGPPPPAAQEWLLQHSLEEVTTRHFHDWGSADHQRTIVIALRFERGAWRLSGIEYDGYLDLIGPVRRGDIVQRELVAEQTAAWALRCYSPLGVITQPEEELFLVEFPLIERLRRLSDWPGLDVGSVLQLYREQVQSMPGQPATISQAPRHDQFLVVAEVRDNILAARLSLPNHPADQPYFAPLTDPAAAGTARFLVRPVDSSAGVCRIRVLTDGGDAPEGKGPRSPREGCTVYLTRTRPSRQDLTRPLGTTDDRGEFSIETLAGHQYVVVVYGAAMYFRPFVPGCSPRAIEFLVPFKSPRLDFGETLNRLGDNLRDRRSRFSDVLKRLLKTVDAADIEATEKLVEEGKRTAAIDDLREELARLKKEADEAKHNLEPVYGQLMQEFAGFAKEVADSPLLAAVAQAEIQGLRQRVNVLWKDKRAWTELQQKMDRLVVLDPTDMVAVQRKKWLDDVLRVDGADHAAARQAIDQAVLVAEAGQFVQGWDKLEPQVRKLIGRQDLWMLRASDAWDRWVEFVNAELKRLDAEVERSGDSISKEDKARLQQRQKDLSERAKQIVALDAQLQAACEAMLKKAPQ
ncbi:MAG: hypothetical protein U0935_22835 [Pirellulales bacterium]